MHSILCLEDCQSVLDILEATLGHHQLVFAKTVESAIDLLKRNHISLAILDIELPDGSGLEMMASFPDAFKDIPVIYLTGRKEFSAKVTAFTLGAEDFILKPFDPKELRLRVDAKLKKVETQVNDRAILKIGSLICNMQEQRVYSNQGQENVSLTALEFRIFCLFARTPNKVFSREEILDRIWGNGFSVTERAVDVHISNIRKKLLKSDVSLEAVIGLGYRIFVGNSTNQATPALSAP